MKKICAVFTVAALAAVSLSTAEAARSFSTDLGLGGAQGEANIDTTGLAGTFNDGEAVVLMKAVDAQQSEINASFEPSDADIQAIKDNLNNTNGNPLQAVLQALGDAVQANPGNAGKLATAARSVYVELTGADDTQAVFQAILAMAMDSIPASFDGAMDSSVQLIALALASEGTNGTQQALASSLFVAAVAKFANGSPEAANEFGKALASQLVEDELAIVMNASPALRDAAGAALDGVLDSESDLFGDFGGIFGGDQGAINQGAILPSPSGGGGGGSSSAQGTQPNSNTGTTTNNTEGGNGTDRAS